MYLFVCVCMCAKHYMHRVCVWLHLILVRSPIVRVCELEYCARCGLAIVMYVVSSCECYLNNNKNSVYAQCTLSYSQWCTLHTAHRYIVLLPHWSIIRAQPSNS